MLSDTDMYPGLRPPCDHRATQRSDLNHTNEAARSRSSCVGGVGRRFANCPLRSTALWKSPRSCWYERLVLDRLPVGDCLLVVTVSWWCTGFAAATFRSESICCHPRNFVEVTVIVPGLLVSSDGLPLQAPVVVNLPPMALTLGPSAPSPSTRSCACEEYPVSALRRQVVRRTLARVLAASRPSCARPCRRRRNGGSRSAMPGTRRPAQPLPNRWSR